MKDQQRSNMQHAIPQNIMDVEFKLIGELTMRQFFYMLVFCGLAYICFMTIPKPFNWPFVIVFVIAGVGFAFVPYQDRGLDEWLVSFIRAINTPSLRIWRKKFEIPTAFSYQHVNVLRQEMITLTPTSSRRKLEEYLQRRDTKEEVDELDIAEDYYIEKVKNAFEGREEAVAKSNIASQAVLDARTINDDNRQLDVGPVTQQPSPQKVSSTPADSTDQQSPQSEPTAPQKDFGSQSDTEGRDLFEQLNFDEKMHELIAKRRSSFDVESSAEKVAIPAPVEEVSFAPEISPAPVREEEKAPVVPEDIAVEEEKEEGEEVVEDIEEDPFIISGKPLDEMTFDSITPDMHSGRRFINLVPDMGEGQIILPIRGEKTLSLQEKEDQFEEDLELKTKQLRELMQQVKEEERKQSYKGGSPVTIPLPSEETVPVVKEKPSRSAPRRSFVEVPLVSQQKLKTIEKEKVKNPVPEVKPTPNLEKEKEQKLEQPREKKKEQGLPNFVESSKVKKVAKKVNSASSMPKTSIPNVISGVVKDTKGDLLEDVIIIVKDMEKGPVRALKTNSLGQFRITTPLDNGRYEMEIDSTNKTGFSFDIISLDLKGQIIPSIEIIGH